MIVKAAVQGCESKVVGASLGGNPRTCWYTPKVKGAIELKKETYKAQLICGTWVAENNYQQAKQSVAWVVIQAKLWLWEFGEVMEQGLQSVPN